MKWVELECPSGHTGKVPSDLNFKCPDTFKDWGHGQSYWRGKVFEDRDRSQECRDKGLVIYCKKCAGDDAFDPTDRYVKTRKLEPLAIKEVDNEHQRMVAFFFKDNKGWGKSNK